MNPPRSKLRGNTLSADLRVLQELGGLGGSLQRSRLKSHDAAGNVIHKSHQQPLRPAGRAR